MPSGGGRNEMTGVSYAVIIFHTSSHTMRAEKILLEAGYICKLIPVPRQISSDCGVCLRIHQNDSEPAGVKLKSSRVEFVEIRAI